MSEIEPVLKSKKVNRRILRIIYVVFLAIGIFILILIPIMSSSRYNVKNSAKVILTKEMLRSLRNEIEKFKSLESKYPESLNEMRQYAKAHPKSDIKVKHFKEYLSNKIEGQGEEFKELNGSGGWYYNANNGEVRVNLTEPIKSYFKFYSGSHQNEIPSEW